MDTAGNFIFAEEDITNRWKDYITELYDDNRTKMPQFAIKSANSILQEVQQAILSMTNAKATGLDDISIDMLKALVEHTTNTIAKLCNIKYNAGYIPTEFYHSTKKRQHSSHVHKSISNPTLIRV